MPILLGLFFSFGFVTLCSAGVGVLLGSMRAALSAVGCSIWGGSSGRSDGPEAGKLRWVGSWRITLNTRAWKVQLHHLADDCIIQACCVNPQPADWCSICTST